MKYLTVPQWNVAVGKSETANSCCAYLDVHGENLALFIHGVPVLILNSKTGTFDVRALRGSDLKELLDMGVPMNGDCVSLRIGV